MNTPMNQEQIGVGAGDKASPEVTSTSKFNWYIPVIIAIAVITLLLIIL